MPDSRGATRAPASGAQSRSNSTAIAVGLSVLLCILAIIYLANRGSGGSTQPTASHGPPAPAPGTCNQPPPTPATASTYGSAPDPSLAQSSTWTATLTTNCGDITLQLYGDKAPQTVASFVFLAQHGYWKDSPCHRLTTAGIYVLQCGDPTGSGSGDPGYQYGIENAPPNGSYPVGTLAMARTSDPNSNGGQFFLVYKNSRLPTTGGGYSIFGRVTGGMDIVQRIAQAGVAGGQTDGAPAQPISILDVSVRKG
jgi:peptidyl-prolyl cis-trans isomerase B (cyclophilin B)